MLPFCFVEGNKALVIIFRDTPQVKEMAGNNLRTDAEVPRKTFNRILQISTLTFSEREKRLFRHQKLSCYGTTKLIRRFVQRLGLKNILI